MEPIKFGEESSSDVVLVVGGQEFFVHKKILADKSEFFDRLFNGDFKEANENRVELKDINAKMFNELLKFIYTGKIEGAMDPGEFTGFQDSRGDSQKDWRANCPWLPKDPSAYKVIFSSECYVHRGGFTQEFVSNFPELLKVANRFDVTDALGKYLAEVEKQSPYKRHQNCPFCERIDALEKCLGKSISSYK